MNDSKKISVLLAIIAVLGFAVYQAAQNSTDDAAVVESEISTISDETTNTEVKTQAPANRPVVQSSEPAQGTTVLPQPSAQAIELRKTPLNEKEIKSINQLSSLVIGGLKKSTTVASTLSSLKSLGLTPVKSIDENPYTGRLTVIRTEDALDGTRYVHIQMVGAKPSEESTQHSSFQIRPGADSFEKGVAMMQKNLPKDAKLKEKTEGYQAWTMANCMEARVHVMNSAEDLAAISQNAFSKDDIGSVNVVVEQDPHCGADDDHGGH